MNIFRKKKIFLDHAAGRENPSALYDDGVAAKKRLDHARTRVAELMHVQARDVIFTGGGTEADNLAVLGLASTGKHIVISDIEHPAVRESAKEFERRGGVLTIVASKEGVATAEQMIKAVRPETVLVSLMYVNNETGAVEPVPRLARLIKEYRKREGSAGPYLHTDASQAAGILSVDLDRLGADLLTLDAAKVGGPKGVGCLIVRPHVSLLPIVFGGGQERGLRAGTENVAGIEAFAEALARAEEGREAEYKRQGEIKKVFLEELREHVPQAIINSPAESAPHIVSVSIPGALHEFVAIKLAARGVAVSTGSSCKNIGSEEHEALRFSFGPDTSKREVREAVKILAEVL